MMLLDTHTYLWFVGDSPLLPKWVKDRIQKSERIYVSIASFWEIAIKNGKGLLELPVPVSRMMDDCALLNIGILPIRGSHLDKLKKLPQIHKDPFDRMIVCQAQAEGLSIVTVDQYVVQYDVAVIQYNKI